MSCHDAVDCNYNGFCFRETCRCDMGWFGNNCTQSLEELSPNAFTVFQVVFLILFSLLLIVVVIRLVFKTIKESKIYGLRKFKTFVRGCRSPYNMLLILIILMCLSQIFWLAIDPFNNDNRFNPALETFLFESAFLILFIMFSIILAVWFFISEELNEQDPKKRKTKLFWFRLAIICFVLFVIATLIAISILRGRRTQEARNTVLGLYVVLLVIQGIFVIAFWMIGRRLHRTIHLREKRLDEEIKKSGPLIETDQNIKNQELREKYAKHIAATAPQEKIEKIESIEIPIAVKERPRFKTEIIKPKRDFSSLPSLTGISDSPMAKLSKTTSTLQQPLDLRHNNDVFLGEKKKLKAIIEENEDDFDLEKDIDFLARRFDHGLQRATTVFDEHQERKIREILERNKVRFEEVDRSESRSDLATDIPLIIGNVDGFVWDVSDEKEVLKKFGSIELEQRREEVKAFKENALVQKQMMSTEPFRHNKKFLKDPDFIKTYHELTRSDKAVIKKIGVLSTVAIVFCITAAIMNLKIYLFNSIKTPGGVIAYVWITRIFIILAVVFLFVLFTIEHSQQTDNLRLIYRIGKSKNRINKLHAFVLPDYLKEEESKRMLECDINYLTTGHSSFLKL